MSLGPQPGMALRSALSAVSITLAPVDVGPGLDEYHFLQFRPSLSARTAVDMMHLTPAA